MHRNMRKFLVACLTLALAAPAMLCVFIPAGAASLNMMAMPHHAADQPAENSAHKQHSGHHGTHHANQQAAGTPDAITAAPGKQNAHSLDCLFKCLDEADQSAIPGEAFKLAQPSDEMKASPLAFFSSKLTAELFAHLPQATGPPEHAPGASIHPAPLRQSNRLRL